MVRYLFYTIGDLTYQSPLVVYNLVAKANLRPDMLHSDSDEWLNCCYEGGTGRHTDNCESWLQPEWSGSSALDTAGDRRTRRHEGK